uniref:fructokinase n=1 Tax=uncultured Chloroflexota bacterium TaxID=166587 RepID=H5SL34_9CHLR|nr:ROK family protein [uncultured Chloroflexota bacterium]
MNQRDGGKDRFPLYGGIEGGGTKFICLVGSGPENIVAEAHFPTTTPEETLQRVCDFFAPYLDELRGIGLASFGPLDLDPTSPTFGFITTTPKPHWAHINILGILRQKLKIPIGIDTDVAAAAMGEFKWGATQGLEPSLYLTVGTGIGGGLIIDGRPFRGLVNLEMGHIRIPHNLNLDPFHGACPYHEDCFEGLASGPAIQARFGKRAETLPDDHPFWQLEAEYIAHALANYIFTIAPRKIVLGGGVMQRDFLYIKVRSRVQELLHGYLAHETLTHHLETYIVPPALGKRSGALGGIALAMQAEAHAE